MPKILIVEDERGLSRAIRDRLHKEGYDISVASDGDSGMDLANQGAFDLIVLDLMVPGRSGLSICQELRKLGSSAAILMLTARGHTKDKVIGLRAGADDYLTKPFEMVELLARIDALLRRRLWGRASSFERYQFGDLQIDTRAIQVTLRGHNVPMSATEFRLLLYLAEHHGATLSREELLREVWNYHPHTSTRTLDVHVAWLRQKIEADPPNPKRIVTLIGLGYKFVA